MKRLPELTVRENRWFVTFSLVVTIAGALLLTTSALIIVLDDGDLAAWLLSSFAVAASGILIGSAGALRLVERNTVRWHQRNLRSIRERSERRTAQLQQIRDVVAYMRARNAAGTVDVERLAEENRQLGEWMNVKFTELENELSVDEDRLKKDVSYDRPGQPEDAPSDLPNRPGD